MDIDLTAEVHNRSRLSYVLLEAMGLLPEQFEKEGYQTKEDGHVHVDVSLTINGHDIPFEKFANMFYDNLAGTIEKEARIMVRDKVGEALDLFIRQTDQIKEGFDELIKTHLTQDYDV